jgi:hypothetical protein
MLQLLRSGATEAPARNGFRGLVAAGQAIKNGASGVDRTGRRRPRGAESRRRSPSRPCEAPSVPNLSPGGEARFLSGARGWFVLRSGGT